VKASIIGKTVYGFVFVAVLPVLLIEWAKFTTRLICLPAPGSRSVGLLIASLGSVFMTAGMAALIFYGKGLPMNAYPPPHLVTRGIFSFIFHPIYTGFAILCIGVALFKNSSGGLWLVSPVVILGCTALVQGLERHDLRQRFGQSLPKPLLHIAEDRETSPSIAERISVYLLVFLPWVILYEAVRFIGIPPDARAAFFGFENRLPVYEWAEFVYASTYFFALLAPLIAATRHDLREFSISGLIATGLIILAFLTVPLIAPPRPFVPREFPGRLLAWERTMDTAAAAFPSFHVLWAFLAASLYAKRFRSLRTFWWGWAVLISISCLATGMHAIIDVLSGFAVFVIVTRRQKVWALTRRFTERMANSWKEWRCGPMRVINYGWYAAAAAFIGIAIIGTLVGQTYIAPVLIVAALSVIAAAVWAQLVEGSPSLLRPYGWNGGLIGAAIGIALAKFLGASVWLLLGAFSVAAPWIQSIGRLRCLVQGCCHGHEAPDTIGIRYTHSMSRVSRLTSLGGRSIHATPLYSILANMIIAVMIARLWFLHAPVSLIVGLYLILSSLARFVEESYRGEPQTKVTGGLRLYQWMAIATTIIGVFVTMIGNTPAAPIPHPNWQTIIAAAGFSLFAWFALGVDFPASNKRFARLA
jgi:protein-S-isoprenylcysteine O-methyltransferase Ste14/membrane-associated phospholipid phosphatase